MLQSSSSTDDHFQEENYNIINLFLCEQQSFDQLFVLIDCVFLHMQLSVCVCVHRVFIFVKSLGEHGGELTDILNTDVYI